MANYEYEKVERIEFDDSCDVPDYHAVTTIQLCELANDGFFDLTRKDWDFGPKFSAEQHAALCKKITNHYWFREIGLVPPGIWKIEFLRKMNEIMPKYIPWYKLVAEKAKDIGHSFDYITGDGNKNSTGQQLINGKSNKTVSGENTRNEKGKDDIYYKSRNVYSDFPQTLLAGRNQDYASSGDDSEYEKIIESEKDITEKSKENANATNDETTNSKNDEKRDYRELREHVSDPLTLIDTITEFDNIDASIINEIEPLFSCLFTVNINAW